MKVYKLTDAGREIARRVDASSDEMQVLNYLLEVKRATDDQLEVVGERWVVRGLERQKLIKVVGG